MMLKASFQIAFLAIEIVLTFYKDIIEGNLMIKFLFFVITAILIAMGVTRLANNLLPADKDYVSNQDREEEF